MRALLATDRTRLPIRGALLGLAMAGLAACSGSDAPTAISLEPDPPPPGVEPGMATLQAAATDAGARIEVEVMQEGGAWLAHEVEIQTASDRDALERLESPLVAAAAATGGLTLQLGGLEVRVADGARFMVDGGREVSRDAFFATVEALIAAGETPGIEVLRPATSPAQAPNLDVFEAEIVRLNADSEDRVIDLNMDGRHLRMPVAGAGMLTLLGVELTVDPGASSVVERSADQAGAVDVDGMAQSADDAAGTVTLEDGTVLRVLAGTRIKTGGDRLASIAHVAAALDGGAAVEVDADAVLESEGVYVAVKISFDPEASDDGSDGEEEEEEEEEGDEEGDGEDEPEGVQFGGNVVSVDLEAGTFLMTTGKVLTVSGETLFDEEGDLSTLEAMAGALEAGDRVMAEGRAVEDEETGAWMVLDMRVETSGEDGDFGGRVASVDLEDGTFTLKSGKVMTLSEETSFDEEGDLTSLEAMDGAIAAGDVVTVEGLAEKDPETGAWTVLEIRVNASGEDGEFGGRVESVDLEAGTFTLKSGKILTLDEGTTFLEEGDLASLDAMAGALAAGDVVTVEGMATKDSETGAWIATELLVETNGEDGEFGGRVASVDTEAGTFTLQNGRVLTVTGETAFDEDGDATSLDDMATALGEGGKLNVSGMMAQDADTGEWLVADVTVKRTGKP
ncbi:MAG: hypothetical protein KJO11_16275 [Gemmatimonadetes bacterium]|nr:hypothetical protein [Gemmatimonadota bacterium]MBT8403975.1 hypothetical protein [Gemmatimonadota bacterium]NNF39680.1 hypothetical protein [Gemmatimonadota bacterium]